MKKYLMFLFIFALLITGCSKTPIEYSGVSIDESRLDIISQGEESNEIISETVDEIISRFNNIADEEIEIGDYTVQEDEYGYIVTTADNISYRIGVDENGEVVTLSLLTGTNDERETFALVAMKLISKKQFAPHSFTRDSETIIKKINAIEETIDKHYEEYFQDNSFISK